MDEINVLRDRLAAICAAARCSECVTECEVAAAKDAADAVLMVDQSLAGKIPRLCALVIEMEGKAVPPDAYTSKLMVGHDALDKAAKLAHEIGRMLRAEQGHTQARYESRPISCKL